MDEQPQDPVLRVVNALTDAGCNPRRQGGEFKAKCPTHEDKRASLQVGPGDRGAVLHCHAGCATAGILRVLKLRQRDLFYDAEKPKAAADNTAASFLYVDEQGQTLFRVERRPGKKFVQSKPGEKGEWVYQLGNVRRVPYRLPQVLAQVALGRTVFIVEGEKDVHTLEGKGFVATCNAGGAGKWQPSFTEHFVGAHVVILPDHDRPGTQHAEAVAAAMLGHARSVKIVHLPGLSEHGDVTDWFEMGHSANDFHRAVNEVEVVPGSVPETFTARELMSREFEEVSMAVPGIIAEGLTFLVGAPKIGKSWMSLGLGKAVAEGGYALGTIPVGEGGDVLYLALEDTERRLHHRFAVMSGMTSTEAPERFHFACRWPRFPEGMRKIELWLQHHKAARMVIVDTWAKVKPSQASDRESMYQADYAQVSAIKALADRFGVAIVLVHHQRKAKDDDPLNTVAGSTGLTGAADAAVILTRERGRPEGKLYITGRDVQETKAAVSFESDTGMWLYLGDAEEVEENRTQDAVIKYLEAQQGVPVAPKEVAEALEMKDGTAKWLLSKMAQEGQIGKVGRGKYVSKDSVASGTSPSAGLVTMGTGAPGTSQPSIPGTDDEDDMSLTDDDVERLLSDGEDFGGDDAEE